MRGLITLLYDALAGASALYLALLLRFGGVIPADSIAALYYALPYALTCFVVFMGLGVHKRMWRYSSTSDALALCVAVGVALFVMMGMMFFINRLAYFPRTAFPIVLLVHLAAMLFPRFVYKRVVERTGSKKRIAQPQRALLVGTGGVADVFLRDLKRQRGAPFQVVGILDDDRGMRHRLMHGVKILGAVGQLEAVVQAMRKKGADVDMVILSEPGLALNRSLLAAAKEVGLKVKRLPSLHDMQSGEGFAALKPVMVEDLLHRKPVTLDQAALRTLVEGKKVLVTGAGGSIGAELCRQIAQRAPDALTLVDHGEHALYSIDMELTRKFTGLKKVSVLADVCESLELEQVFKKGQFDVVFHAAAYKHVPLVESNVHAGVKTNVLGTRHVADMCHAHHVGVMVLVSTDKAVNPTSVMGASKRAAELYCQNLESGTRYVTVRFGNVLGSTGSVVPLFERQIRDGGPVTITHKDMKRYFMTIPEAVQLVMQAAVLSEEKEKNPIYMLNMGKPVHIYDLAVDMIRLSGLEVGRDIDIQEIGLRPGEKLFEEMSYASEDMGKTPHKDIYCMKPVSLDKSVVLAHCEAISVALEVGDEGQVVKALKEMVAEYHPSDNSPFFVA